MSLRPRGQHDLPLMEEFDRIYKLLDGPTSALTRLLVFLSGDRLFHQSFSGYVPAGGGGTYVFFGEANYQAASVRVYAMTSNGADPGGGVVVTVGNVTQGTSENGTISTWSSGAGQTDVDLDISGGDEVAMSVNADPALHINFNVKIVPDSEILLDMTQYPAEFRTEE